MTAVKGRLGGGCGGVVERDWGSRQRLTRRSVVSAPHHVPFLYACPRKMFRWEPQPNESLPGDLWGWAGLDGKVWGDDGDRAPWRHFVPAIVLFPELVNLGHRVMSGVELVFPGHWRLSIAVSDPQTESEIFFP